jgi:hypothetical protein
MNSLMTPRYCNALVTDYRILDTKFMLVADFHELIFIVLENLRFVSVYPDFFFHTNHSLLYFFIGE